MKHLPAILFAILAVVFLVLYITKDPAPIPDTKSERDQLRSERDSLVRVVSAREERTKVLMDSINTYYDSLLVHNAELLEKELNKKPYEPPRTIIAASTEWDSIFSAHGIPGHAYLLLPKAK
jgi:hypothetical protein